MVSDKIYEQCLPVLADDTLGEEEKTDRLEELLGDAPSALKGKALEDAVLGVLWQWKSTNDKSVSPPPAPRSTAPALNRTKSPASWTYRAGTPTSNAASPRSTSAAVARSSFVKTASSTTASPFSSPKPSPRLPVATPSIPHGSPRLSVYQPSSSPPTTVDKYGDYGSDTVDWLVNDDDESSNTSFSDAGYAAGTDFLPSYTTDMSPYDMLRSILQNNSTDEELDQILDANGYDLGQTVNSIMGAAATPSIPEPARTFLVGKSMSPSSRPATPVGQHKSPVVCRYWLASGHCARADCRFAHEVQNSHLCKYWLQGNCLAGVNCLFSHDPSSLVSQISIASGANTPQLYNSNFQLQDYDSFPALVPTTSNPYDDSTGPSVDPTTVAAVLQEHQQGTALFPSYVPTGPRYGSRPNSRPTSRHSSRAPTPSQPNFQDDEAFPTLGSAAASKPQGKRHHGKRGGHGHHATVAPPQPASLADVVRMSPSPQPRVSSNSREALRRGLRNNRSFTSSRENSSQAMTIPPPTEVPWLETGENSNQAYLKARQEAFRHGGQRNKFLQSAAQAWNRNDARGAKALSLRGQNENNLMREAHREAARVLYEERNKAQGSSKELYIDLHGLHPDEAVNYLSTCLVEQKTSSRPVYAICGTGHHSKNGKDKVGRAVRQFLNEWRYAFREFSVPGDRNNMGGILGIDATSYDKTISDGADSGIGLEESAKPKVTIIK